MIGGLAVCRPMGSTTGVSAHVTGCERLLGRCDPPDPQACLRGVFSAGRTAQIKTDELAFWINSVMNVRHSPPSDSPND